MSNLFFHIADWFFLIFHTVFTLFNIFGWMNRKTRKIHLFTMAATSFSWFVLGIWYGFGFCFCTEWHWQVRRILGNPITSYSYIHFLIKEITGIDLNQQLVDKAVISIFMVTVVLTIFVNFRDHLKSRQK